MISKSLIMLNDQCPLATYLKTHHKKEMELSPSTQRIFDMGHEVNEYAFKHLSKGKSTLVDTLETNRALELTQEGLEACESVFEGAFLYEGVLVRIDILRKNGDGWDLIEVKSSTKTKESHIKDASIQFHIASQFINIKQVYVATINRSSYSYPDAIFNLDKINDLIDLKWVRESIQNTWDNTKYESSIKPNQQCSNPYDCAFLKFCKKRNKIPEVSTLDFSFPNRWDYVDKGIYDLSKVKGDHKFIKYLKKPYINYEGLKEELKNLGEYHSLDFESIAFPVPQVDYLIPYENIPFQFSIHTFSKLGISHKEYLNTTDGEYLEVLVKALLVLSKDKLPILVWNESFEINQIKKLAKLFPKYSDDLLSLVSRIVDLMKIIKRNYYHPKMAGSFSLKAVAPVLSDLDYKELEINNGTLAQAGYIKLLREYSVETENNLKEYCAQDTLIPIQITENLKKLLLETAS